MTANDFCSRIIGYFSCWMFCILIVYANAASHTPVLCVQNQFAFIIDLRNFCSVQIRPMSFPCVLGMNEVGWEDGAYHSNGMTPKLVGRTSNGGSKTNNSGFEIDVGGKSNGEVASYLFQRQGVATSFSKTVSENDKGNFSGQRWSSVGEGMSEQVKTYVNSVILACVYDRVELL